MCNIIQIHTIEFFFLRILTDECIATAIKIISHSDRSPTDIQADIFLLQTIPCITA